MFKILVSSVAALAFMASDILPIAAMPIPKISQMTNAKIVTDGMATEVSSRRDYYYKKKRRHNRPHIYFYYNPWPYYYQPYRDPFFYGRYPYWNDYYFDDYDYDYRPRMRISHNKHTKWCKAHYRTYNVKSDTFVGKNRKRYRCNSPYDRR